MFSLTQVSRGGGCCSPLLASEGCVGSCEEYPWGSVTPNPTPLNPNTDFSPELHTMAVWLVQWPNPLVTCAALVSFLPFLKLSGPQSRCLQDEGGNAGPSLIVMRVRLVNMCQELRIELGTVSSMSSGLRLTRSPMNGCTLTYDNRCLSSSCIHTREETTF